MNYTSLETIINYLHSYKYKISNKNLNKLSLHILNLLLGFFISTALSTIPGQTGDWGIIGAAMIVAFYEIISQRIYLLETPTRYNSVILQINNIKVGIIYGLFVDAFKLGS
uniref:Uncharacterized protein ycf20 n=1 Tax=Dichotomaria marginata TaxID=268567 RepID=A0A1G4NSC9_9FLOR|nr:Hypothetical protein ycf20 [Dichotomaria marginata]SCW21515.1 Hypothetical protein ycf20 [Dichotomaria marginata]